MHVHTEGNLPRNRKVESLIACITLVTATIYFFTLYKNDIIPFPQFLYTKLPAIMKTTIFLDFFIYNNTNNASNETI